MLKQTLRTSAFLLLAAVNSTQAGTAVVGAGKGKSTPAQTTAAAASAVSGSYTLGYDSSYVFRGLNFGDHLFSGTLDVNVALSDQLTWNINAFYGMLGESSQLSVPSADYNEFDLFTGLLYNAGSVTFGPTFKWYNYHNGGELAVGLENQYEFGIMASTKVGMLDVTGSANYELETEAVYFELGASTAIKLTESVSLVPGAIVSYGDFNNLGTVNDWNHAAVYLKLPITLTESMTLTPYVAANFPFAAVDAVGAAVPSASLDNEIYGGVSLNVKF